MEVFDCTARESLKTPEWNLFTPTGKPDPSSHRNQSFDRKLELHCPLELEVGTPGALNSIRWVNGEEANGDLASEDVEIKALAVSLDKLV